ncbi:MAG: type II toxin-antitoxin system VapB family antitoxin [Oscillospiraceae bacterium]|nr:type II toxin-antitoxin system VapB family antitoxin [Oscillospiraceae bacterium]
MDTAKLFTNGQSQAVRLPKDCRFFGNEVGIKKIGEIVLLFPKDNAWEEFLKCPPVSDDFGEAILEARRENYNDPREQL